MSVRGQLKLNIFLFWHNKEKTILWIKRFWLMNPLYFLCGICTFSFYDELLYRTLFVASSYFYVKICNSKVQENIVVILLFVSLYVSGSCGTLRIVFHLWCMNSNFVWSREKNGFTCKISKRIQSFFLKENFCPELNSVDRDNA